MAEPVYSEEEATTISDDYENFDEAYEPHVQKELLEDNGDPEVSAGDSTTEHPEFGGTAVDLSEFEHPLQVLVQNGPVATISQEFGGKGNAFSYVMTFKNGHSISVTDGAMELQSNGQYRFYAKGGIVNHSGGDVVEITEGTYWDVPQGNVVLITGDANTRKNRSQDKANKANSTFFTARAGFSYNKNEVNLLDVDDLFNWDVTRILKKCWKAPKNFEFLSSKSDDFLTKLALFAADIARYYAQVAVETASEASDIAKQLITEKVDSIKEKINQIDAFCEDGVMKRQMMKALESGNPNDFFKFVYNPAQANADEKQRERDSEEQRDDTIVENSIKSQEQAAPHESSLGGR